MRLQADEWSAILQLNPTYSIALTKNRFRDILHATEQIAQQETMNPVHPVREAAAQPQEPAVVNPHPEVVIDPPPAQFPNEV